MVHLVLKGVKDVFAAVFCWGIAIMLGLLTGASNSGKSLSYGIFMQLYRVSVCYDGSCWFELCRQTHASAGHTGTYGLGISK